ncbi:MAG TPA: pilin [Candidatus Saccharimonadales bacterium]
MVLAFTLKPGDNVNIPTAKPDDVLNNVLGIVYFAGGAACVIVIVVAGILYATSNGDSGKVKTAKDAILYAVIGLVVIMMAFVITGFVLGRF